LLSTHDPKIVISAVMAGLDALHETFRPGEPSSKVSTIVLRRSYEALGDPDPYLEKKIQSREIAAGLMPVVRSLVGDKISVEGFRRAALAAAIGNSFDYGVDGFDVREDDFEAEFMKLFNKGLDVDDIEIMAHLLDNVVYLADNSGEILLDTLVIEQIRGMGGKVTLVVRGGPILNDATMEDVEIHGIGEMVDRVLTTGSNAIGVCLDEAPPELVEALEDATLIISKGMANYETMSEYGYSPIAYMLRTKCRVVADEMGLDMGMLVARLVV
jgi:hypothetical protein